MSFSQKEKKIVLLDYGVNEWSSYTLASHSFSNFIRQMYDYVNEPQIYVI